MAKECVLSTGNLPLGSLPRNSVFRIIDRPDMTLAVSEVFSVSNKARQTIYFPQPVKLQLILS